LALVRPWESGIFFMKKHYLIAEKLHLGTSILSSKNGIMIFVLEVDETFYKQTDGMAMGSSLSCILSNLVLESLFDVIIPNLPYKPSAISKYIDDILIFLPQEHIQTMLTALNGYHSKLHFTVKVEHNSCLNYLDMKLVREGLKISTDWYSKE
jgi:hypothetical protein